MLDDKSIEGVEKFGEKLRDRLQIIGNDSEWGAKFDLLKAGGSDYYSAKVIIEGEPIKKNWVQLNGQTYFHPSYTSPKPWKLLARFSSPPGSLLWEKKPPYIYNRQPKEWSLGGEDVWAISYENLAEALSNKSEDDIMDEILEDLRVSYCYANLQQPPQDSTNTLKPAGADRVDITFSIDEKIWSEFREIVAQQYRPRRKHPKRPSYAKLQNDAIDSALMLYINQWKGLGQDEDQASEK